MDLIQKEFRAMIFLQFLKLFFTTRASCSPSIWFWTCSTDRRWYAEFNRGRVSSRKRRQQDDAIFFFTTGYICIVPLEDQRTVFSKKFSCTMKIVLCTPRIRPKHFCVLKRWSTWSITHSVYSPDREPCDISLFPKIKDLMRISRFTEP